MPNILEWPSYLKLLNTDQKTKHITKYLDISEKIQTLFSEIKLLYRHYENLQEGVYRHFEYDKSRAKITLRSRDFKMRVTPSELANFILQIEQQRKNDMTMLERELSSLNV
jgi:hypothetical protein